MAIELLNIDCMEYMRTLPDKAFDLAIVDPPYGIGIVQQMEKSVKSDTSMMKLSKGIAGGHWDNAIPEGAYFDELRRVSKNQIIWGGNYFLDYLGSTRCFCVWDKMNGTNPMADAELAWTSFSGSISQCRRSAPATINYHACYLARITCDAATVRPDGSRDG